jgi:hypothetical protein
MPRCVGRRGHDGRMLWGKPLSGINRGPQSTGEALEALWGDPNFQELVADERQRTPGSQVLVGLSAGWQQPERSLRAVHHALRGVRRSYRLSSDPGAGPKDKTRGARGGIHLAQVDGPPLLVVAVADGDLADHLAQFPQAAVLVAMAEVGLRTEVSMSSGSDRLGDGLAARWADEARGGDLGGDRFARLPGVWNRGAPIASEGANGRLGLVIAVETPTGHRRVSACGTPGEPLHE